MPAFSFERVFSEVKAYCVVGLTVTRGVYRSLARDPRRNRLILNDVLHAIAERRMFERRLGADRGVDFGFETTLAGRAYAGWIKELRRRGYSFHLIYLWLRDVDLAIKRVQRRVDLGGHDVPEETIRRRYRVGLVNFFGIYRPLAKTWRFYDNSFEGEPILIAEGTGSKVRSIRDRDAWLMVNRKLRHNNR